MSDTAEQIWPTEGESYDVKRRIFLNQRISEFLDGDGKTILVAPKGMGKTLLLKKKRQAIKNENRSISIIPHDMEVDYIKLPHTFSSGFVSELKNIQFWKSLWEFSFELTALLNCGDNDRVHEFFSLNQKYFPYDTFKHIENWMEYSRPQASVRPSAIASDFLTDTPARFLDFQRKVSNELSQLCSTEIRFGIHFFIDSFDQELRQMSGELIGAFDRDIWCNGQMGLIKAAWDIRRRNPHIKVFTSARQEAWSSYFDEDRQSITGHVQFLEYSRNDMLGITNVLFSQYENSEDLVKYLGFDSIPNKGSAENVFDYMLRHSLGRPRGIAVIGGRLHGQITDEDAGEDRIGEFRRIINEAAPEDLIQNYLKGEMRPFLRDLNSDERVDFLWRNIPSNILTMSQLDRIRNRFADRFGLLAEDCHPFCELLNLGLLGYVGTGRNGDKVQIFRGPTDFSWDLGRILPGNVIYILHPALTDIIRRQNANFSTSDSIITGRDMPWLAAYEAARQKDMASIFVSYASKNGALVRRCTEQLGAYFDTHGLAAEFWQDRWNIRAGDGFQEALEKGLRESDLVLLFYTRDAAESGWVEEEWRMAQRQEVSDRQVRLIPVTDASRIASAREGFLKGKHFHLIETAKTGGKGAFERSMAKLGSDICQHLLGRKPVDQGPGGA